MYNWIFFIGFILLFIFYPKKHPFWDQQPVPRNNNPNYGVISINPTFNINLRNNYIFKPSKLSKWTLTFINRHFSPYNKFKPKFLMETLDYNDYQKIHNIELYEHNKLVGFIHAKPIDIILEGIKLQIYYVDFLWIHKDFRKKNLATYLIAELINRCHRNQLFLFKKDNYPLPFNYICKTAYYYKFTKDISKRKINHIFQKNPQNIRDIYHFIQSTKKNYQCYDTLLFEEFKKLYVDKVSKNIIVEYKDTSIISVSIYVNNVFTYKKKYHNTLDIEYIYIQKKNLGKTQIIDYLKNMDRSNTIITCIDQMNALYFIKKYRFNKSMDLFYHMYNYTINKTLKTDSMAFNPL